MLSKRHPWIQIPCFLMALAAILLDASAGRFVYEEFEYDESQTLWTSFGDGGYGLRGPWNKPRFESGSITDYRVRSGGLTGIPTSNSKHLERPQRGSLSRISRNLGEPIGTPGTIRYVGCLLRLPSTSELRPTGLTFGLELSGPNQTAIYMGCFNVSGRILFALRESSDFGKIVISARECSAAQSYFCVLKLEFLESSTVCSLYVDGITTNEPDAVKTIAPGALDEIRVASNYTFSIDEIRIADSISDLRRANSLPPPSLYAQSSASIVEGHSGTNELVLNIQRSHDSEWPSECDAVAVELTANSEDFVAETIRVRFESFETQKSIRVKVKGDRVFEPDETFVVVFADRMGLSRVPQITVKITNDDVQPAPVTLTTFLDANKLIFLDWNVSPQRMILQESSNLLEWTDVTPAIGSNEAGSRKIEAPGSVGFYRFRSE